jgi:hypothetical protein
LTDVDFFRLLIILLVGYLVLAHWGLVPSRLTAKTAPAPAQTSQVTQPIGEFARAGVHQ